MALAVIFDLDGCLADSEPLSLEAVAAEMRGLGIEDARADRIRHEFLGVTIGAICTWVSDRTGKPCPPDFQHRIESRLFRSYEQGLDQIPGARALLEELRDAEVPMAIATGGSLERMGKTLHHAGLADLFVGRGFSAEQVRHGKPAPDLFLFAAGNLGVAPADCIVVEDSPHGIKGAVAAGMRAFGFVGGSHLDGIRDSHVETLRSAGAEAVFDDLAALSRSLHRALGE
ncbi:MAG: HAD family phosphatase [Maritimibacter sp.]|nr:HAD family phosphatase [Maritimibacter sp.]